MQKEKTLGMFSREEATCCFRPDHVSFSRLLFLSFVSDASCVYPRYEVEDTSTSTSASSSISSSQSLLAPFQVPPTQTPPECPFSITLDVAGPIYTFLAASLAYFVYFVQARRRRTTAYVTWYNVSGRTLALEV